MKGGGPRGSQNPSLGNYPHLYIDRSLINFRFLDLKCFCPHQGLHTFFSWEPCPHPIISGIYIIYCLRENILITIEKVVVGIFLSDLSGMEMEKISNYECKICQGLF